MIPLLIGAAAGLLSEAIDSENRREVAMQESRNRRNADIARTLVEGAVAAFGAYQQAKVNSSVHSQAISSYGNNVSQKAQLSAPEPFYSVDKKSVWLDRARNEIGARVVEENSGQTINVKYKIQSIGNKVHKIYECINGGNWSQVGMVDWKYMRPSDLGSDETGGPIFAEIMQTAMNKR